MLKKFAFLFALVLAVAILPQSVLAENLASQLGIETQPQTVSIPATPEGPGLLLPDSPLFPLDLLKQQVRIFFSLSPESKVLTYKSIAGERMAELRIMLSRNNQNGIRTDLEGIGDNLKAAANQLAEAQLTGRDVTKLAGLLNEDIKTTQGVIDALQAQSTGQLRSEVATTSIQLLSAKISVENSLPQSAMEREAKADIDSLLKKQTAEVEQAKSQLYIIQALAGKSAQVAGTSSSSLNSPGK